MGLNASAETVYERNLKIKRQNDLALKKVLKNQTAAENEAERARLEAEAASARASELKAQAKDMPAAMMERVKSQRTEKSPHESRFVRSIKDEAFSNINGIILQNSGDLALRREKLMKRKSDLTTSMESLFRTKDGDKKMESSAAVYVRQNYQETIKANYGKMLSKATAFAGMNEELILVEAALGDSGEVKPPKVVHKKVRPRGDDGKPKSLAVDRLPPPEEVDPGVEDSAGGDGDEPVKAAGASQLAPPGTK